MTSGLVRPSARVISPCPAIWLQNDKAINGHQLVGMIVSPIARASASKGTALASVEAASNGSGDERFPRARNRDEIDRVKYAGEQAEQIPRQMFGA